LYYRLSVLPLQWAPLRDRTEDIIPLAEKILLKHAQKQNRYGVHLSASAQQALLDYSWPGNVRELDNIMQRALILQVANMINSDDLGLHVDAIYSQKLNVVEAALQYQNQTHHTRVVTPQAVHTTSGNVGVVVRELSEKRDHPQEFHRSAYAFENTAIPISNNSVFSPALGSDLKQREYEIIMTTLQKEGGSRKNTAERLGISARTLRYKMARLREDGYAITE
jgi:two-component system, response regulator FlrC